MGSPNYIVSPGHGHDEHGPAYPDRPYRHSSMPPPYRCPICTGNENRFMTCEYPGCPDGCDQPHRFRSYPNQGPLPLRSPTWPLVLVGWAVAIALLVHTFWPHA